MQGCLSFLAAQPLSVADKGEEESVKKRDGKIGGSDWDTSCLPPASCPPPPGTLTPTPAFLPTSHLGTTFLLVVVPLHDCGSPGSLCVMAPAFLSGAAVTVLPPLAPSVSTALFCCWSLGAPDYLAFFFFVTPATIAL